jgi:ferric-dicitrate binding protein FerR (iron transport regulator)
MNNIKIDIQLIGKYLAGEATPDEAVAINDWLTIPGNRKEYEQVERLFTGTVHRAPSPAEEWTKLRAVLPAPVKKPLFIHYGIAAVLTSVLVALSLFWYTRTEPVTWQSISSDGIVRSKLPDSSAIVINKGSKISYPADFNKKDRQVVLEGECFFDISHDKNKPFLVHINKLSIQVLGTSFNVREEGNIIEVPVKTGKVKMYTDEHALIVSAGQTGIYNAINAELSLKDTIDVNHLGYATGDFYFRDMSLQEIAHYLENAYGVKVIIDDDQLLQSRMSAHFKNRSVNYIVDLIAATLDLQYDIKGNVIHLRKN